MPLAAANHRAEHVNRQHDPYERDGDIYGPFKFCILFPGRHSQRQGYRGCNDDRLPAPEMNLAQNIAEHSALAQPLQRIVESREDAVPHERKYHRVRMKRTKPAECKKLQSGVDRRLEHLECYKHADEPPYRPPQHRRDGEVTYDPVVVPYCYHLHSVWFLRDYSWVARQKY